MLGGAERWQQPPRLPYTCGGLVPPPGACGVGARGCWWGLDLALGGRGSLR